MKKKKTLEEVVRESIEEKRKFYETLVRELGNNEEPRPLKEYLKRLKEPALITREGNIISVYLLTPDEQEILLKIVEE